MGVYSLRESPLLLIVCSVLFCAGCGQKDWATVSGTVKLNGSPIGPGTIMFEPAGSASPRARSGVGNFQEDGRYVVRSAGGRDGIPTGEYTVIINGKSAAESGDERVPTGQKSKIPAKYLKSDVSGLNASLKPGENVVDFDLKP